MERRSLLWSKVWYAWSFSTSAVLYPLLNIYFKRKGYNESEIGVISAMRPWVSAVCGNFWAGLADHLAGANPRAHKAVLMFTYISSVIVRYALGLATSFPVTVALMALTEACSAPLTILADASVMAAVTEEGAYGRTRMWGAVGWGAFSPLGGLLVSRFGPHAAFDVNAIMGLLGIIPTALLPTDALYEKKQRAQQDLHGSHHDARPRPDEMASDRGRSARVSEGMPASLGLKEETLGMLREAGAVESSYGTLAERRDRLVKWTKESLEEAADQHADDSSLCAGISEEDDLTNTAAKDGGASTAASPFLAIQNADTEVDLRLRINARREGGDAGAGGAAGTPDVGMSWREQAECHMRRGDSLLKEVAEQVPLASAPELQDFDAHLLLMTPTMRPTSAVFLSPRSSIHIPESMLHTATPLRSSLADEARSTVEEQAAALSTLQKLAAIFSNGEVVIFFIMTVLMGFATGTIDTYLFLYLDQLGGPELLMGLTITVACIIELPVFHYMASILRKVGVERMLHLVLFFFLVRLGCYATLGYWGSPWAVLPVETLNGITFGCAWAAGTVNCSRIAPLGLEATTQAIFTGLYMGGGVGAGGLIGGWVYHRYGAQATFGCAFLVVLAGWGMCAIAQQIIRCLAARRGAASLQLEKPLLS